MTAATSTDVYWIAFVGWAQRSLRRTWTTTTVRTTQKCSLVYSFVFNSENRNCPLLDRSGRQSPSPAPQNELVIFTRGHSLWRSVKWPKQFTRTVARSLVSLQGDENELTTSFIQLARLTAASFAPSVSSPLLLPGSPFAFLGAGEVSPPLHSPRRCIWPHRTPALPCSGGRWESASCLGGCSAGAPPSSAVAGADDGVASAARRRRWRWHGVGDVDRSLSLLFVSSLLIEFRKGQ